MSKQPDSNASIVVTSPSHLKGSCKSYTNDSFEVFGTAEDYGILAAKVAKINRFIVPRETVVFNAIGFVDRYLDTERKRGLAKILGFEPSSYREVDEHYQKILEKEHGLRFTPWSEEDLKKI